MKVTTCIYLKTNDAYCRFMYSDIYCIEASGSYCNVHLFPIPRKLTLAMTLTELMEYLPSHIFIRTHRTFIVNITHIERIVGNTIYIGTATIPIGREYKKNVLSGLNIIGI